ncbi:hypothetical protein [Halomonas campaniensis]|uniref:hypothetical protein n=1 Tax=Halomonas campaniensis TaxID=213554 RepID=UPI003970D29E
MTSFTGCILIDARTSGARLPRQLAALAGGDDDTRPRFNLVVADDTGDPRLPAIARRYGALRVPCPAGPLGARLNAAVLHCSGVVVLIPVAKRTPPRHILIGLASGIIAQTHDAVLLPAGSSGRLAGLLARLRRSPSCDALCLSREWFERIGGFDPELEASALPELVERLRACGARVASTAR